MVDITKICPSFPELKEPLVKRENYLEMIDYLYDVGNSIVVLEGGEGFGKTTLSAMYAQRHKECAVGVYISGASRWGYDVANVRKELCLQIGAMVEWKGAKEESPATDGKLRSLLFELQKKARHDRCYFTVDGLDEIPTSEAGHARAILELLPFGLPGFKFLVTAREAKHFQCPKGTVSKSYPLAGFGVDETRAYLSDVVQDAALAKELHALCKGRPGYLASVRRNLRAGSRPEDVVKESPNRLQDLYDLEWRHVKSDNEGLVKALAILAHDKGGLHTSERIDALAELSQGEARVLLEDLSFLERSDGGSYKFVSEGYRDFAEKKTRHLAKWVLDVTIDDLLRNPTGDSSLARLPLAFKAAGRHGDLISYLSGDIFTAILQKSQSLAPLRATASLGLNAALEEDRDEHLIRFALHRSAFKEIEEANAWREEIEARMAVDDIAGAISCAQTAALVEDRLSLFALVARLSKEKGLTPQAELLDDIARLFGTIDKDALGERRQSLAGDLLFTIPDIAVKLAEQGGIEKGQFASSDVALASLAVQAYALNEIEPDRVGVTIETISSRIKNPHVRELTTAVTSLIGSSSAVDLIESVKRVNNVKLKMHLLCLWVERHRRRPDAIVITRHTLSLAIAAGEYTPNATDMRRACCPLPFSVDRDAVNDVIKTLDALAGSFENYGPTVDYVRLQLLIAEAELGLESSAAQGRVRQTVELINAIPDLPTQIESQGHLASFAHLLNTRSDPVRCGVATEDADNKLHLLIDTALGMSASHHAICKGALRALGPTRPDLSRSVALKFNTESRRDLGLVEIVRAIAGSRRSPLNFTSIESLLQAIRDGRLVDEACLIILRRLNEDGEIPTGDMASFVAFIPRTDSIQSAPLRCFSIATVIKVLTKSDVAGTYGGLRDDLANRLNQSLLAIDRIWERIQAAYHVVAILAETNLALAKRYLSTAEALKSEHDLQAPETAHALIVSLRLATASLAGLLLKRHDAPHDFARLAELIDLVPSYGERALLWGDVAIRLLHSNRSDDAKTIVYQHVFPSFDRIPIDDSEYRAQVLGQLSRIMHLSNPIVTNELIATYPTHIQDDIVESMIM